MRWQSGDASNIATFSCQAMNGNCHHSDWMFILKIYICVCGESVYKKGFSYKSNILADESDST